MIYKINFILFFLLLYLLFFNYFIINNLDSRNLNQLNTTIKFTIYNQNYIKTEILDSNIEYFNNYLIPLEQQVLRFNNSESPNYCNNIDCNFPVYLIGDKHVSLNNIEYLIDVFYNYINNLNREQKNNLRESAGFNLYQFSDGKLYFNNQNYCNLKQGGFKSKNVKRLLPIRETCDINLDGCTFENGRYYVETDNIENSFCNQIKNIEVEGSMYCKNNLDISFNGKLCLSFDKYLPILLLHIIDNNYNYIIDIQDYKPDNIINFKNKIENAELEEVELEEEVCPPNSSLFNNICKCNFGYSCSGNNCNQNVFSLENCYNCSCNISA